MRLSDISVVRELLDRHGFTFSKALGQNFLINPSVCPAMAESCGIDSESGVIEIGPGIGVLTCELAQRAKKVVAIELDDNLLPVLAETLADYDNVEVVHADVLEVDLQALIEEKFPGMPVYVCANLPYYITSPILMYLLESRLPLQAITVMVQKEAAQRLCAPLGTREAGAVTAAVAYYAEAKKLFQVSAGSFMPAPKVDSAVIRLDLRQTPPVEVKDEKNFLRFMRSAFGQRRKTAANSISSGYGVARDKVQAAIEAAGLQPSIRAEAMTMEDFAAVFAAMEE